MALFISSGAAAKAQMLQARTGWMDEVTFFQSLGAEQIAEGSFIITHEQYKQYMQWKQERSIATKQLGR